MLPEYYTNIELSKKIAKRFRFALEPRACYKNVALLAVTHSLENVLEDYEQLQVAFGAMCVPVGKNPLYVRHCFFLYKDKIIDTCINFYKSEVKADDPYYVFQTYTVPEYIKMFNKQKRDPGLSKTMEPIFRKYEQEFALQGKFII